MGKILDVKDVSKALSITEQTARRMMANGVIPAVKVGRRWYVSEACFNELIEVCGNENDR